MIFMSEERVCVIVCLFFQAEDGIRDLVRSRGLGDVYKRQVRGILFDGTVQNFIPIDDSVSVDNSTSGISSTGANATFFAFPNPANQTVSIYSKNTISKVSIVDLSGKILMTMNNYTSGDQIDVSHLPQGCYFLQTENPSGKQQKLLSITR